MTPLMQRGFDDAKAGGIDPILGTADTAEAKEYRDGHRQARRDALDGIELEGEKVPAGFAAIVCNPAHVAVVEKVYEAYREQLGVSPIVIESTPEPVGAPKVFNVELVNVDAPPVKKRKPKPAPADDQLSLL